MRTPLSAAKARLDSAQLNAARLLSEIAAEPDLMHHLTASRFEEAAREIRETVKEWGDASNALLSTIVEENRP